MAQGIECFVTKICHLPKHRASSYDALKQMEAALQVGHILYLSGIQSRDTMTGYRMRGYMPFLDREVQQGPRSEKFHYGHALAVAAFAQLRALGMPPVSCGAAVEQSWHDILCIVGLRNDAPRSQMCGILAPEFGQYVTFGAAAHHGGGATPVMAAHVDLTRVWQWMQPTLAQVEAGNGICGPNRGQN